MYSTISKPFYKLILFLAFLNVISTALAYGSGREPAVTEDVEVRFVTRLRHKRSLEFHDYHIIELLRANSNSKLEIHLFKSQHLLSEDFEFIVRNGSSMLDQSENSVYAEDSVSEDCIFSGTVIGRSEKFRPLTGEAVFSACHDEQEGFTGLISTNEGQYFLQPKAAKSSVYQSFAVPASHDGVTNFTIRHTLSLITEDDGQTNAHKCEGSIYPPDEEKTRGNSDERASHEDKGREGTGSVPPLEPDEIPKDIVVPTSLKGGQISGISSKIKITIKNNNFSSTDSTETGNPMVEMAVFVDETCLAALEKRLGTKSVKVLKNYVVTLVQMMSIIWQRQSISPNVDFRLVRIEFFTKNPSELKTHHGSLIPFLDSFCAYGSKRMLDDGSWDHSMLLTGVDMRSGIENSPVGVAFTRGMCKKRHSCSIVEGYSFSAANVMAHEMGHSLGMDHDGEEDNTSCKPLLHIMSAVVGPDLVDWSSCSNENLSRFLKYVTSTPPNFHERGYCLGNPGPDKHYKFNKKLPGEVYPADKQCAIHDPLKPIAVTPENGKRFVTLDIDMCKRMYCTDTNALLSFFAHPALEGTECAAGKWCRAGECVKKE